MAEPRLYERCRLPDGRPGCVYGLMFRRQDPPLVAYVLTDDYCDVSIDYAALAIVRRRPPTVQYRDGVNTVRMLAGEVARLEQLKAACRSGVNEPLRQDLRGDTAPERPRQLTLWPSRATKRPLAELWQTKGGFG